MISKLSIIFLLQFQMKKKGFIEIQHLEKNGIGTAIYYKKPLSDLNFDWIEKAESFKNINYIKRILCLPIYSNLDEDKINYVVEKIRKFYGS